MKPVVALASLRSFWWINVTEIFGRFSEINCPLKISMPLTIRGDCRELTHLAAFHFIPLAWQFVMTVVAWKKQVCSLNSHHIVGLLPSTIFSIFRCIVKFLPHVSQSKESFYGNKCDLFRSSQQDLLTQVAHKHAMAAKFYTYVWNVVWLFNRYFLTTDIRKYGKYKWKKLYDMITTI